MGARGASTTNEEAVELLPVSSRTPTECVELATDESADQDEREHAIQELKNANECDELAELVRTDDLEDQYRRRALRSMGTSQCDSMLRKLVEEESLDQQLQQRAEEILADLDG